MIWIYCVHSAFETPNIHTNFVPHKPFSRQNTTDIHSWWSLYWEWASHFYLSVSKCVWQFSMAASYDVLFLLFLSLECFREIQSAAISLTVIARKQDNTNRSYYRKPVTIRFQVRKKKGLWQFLEWTGIAFTSK